MPVKKDPSGQRSVEAEVEAPGTPEEVWRAIATGPGITSWFVPSEVEERAGGTAVSHFGPGNSMDSVGKITEWNPPHRFAVDTQEGPGTVATEWTVEARSGGTCVVRVVHRWFAESDDWDGQFEGAEFGWAGFFRILRLSLTHFPGQPSAAFQVMGAGPEPVAEAWAAFVSPLGLADAAEGQRVRSASGAPPLAGVAEWVGPPEYPGLLLRIEEPAPGLANFFAFPMGGQVPVFVRFYFYGEGAAAAAAREEPVWQAWMADRLAGSTDEAARGFEETWGPKS